MLQSKTRMPVQCRVTGLESVFNVNSDALGWEACNEARREVFFPYLQQAPAGAYFGIGGSQNYEFLDHTPARLAYLVDHAINVMAAHHHAKALFTEAEGEDEFNALRKNSGRLKLEHLTEQEKQWHSYPFARFIPFSRKISGRISRHARFRNIQHSPAVSQLYHKGGIELLWADAFSPALLEYLRADLKEKQERITVSYFSNALSNPMYGWLTEPARAILSDERVFDPQGIVLQTMVPGEADERYFFPEDRPFHWHYSILSMRKFCELLKGDPHGYVSFSTLPLEGKMPAPVSCLL